jgi:hypothetical protein
LLKKIKTKSDIKKYINRTPWHFGRVNIETEKRRGKEKGIVGVTQ